MALPELLLLKELTTIRGSADYGEQSGFERIFRVMFVSRVLSHEDMDDVKSLGGLPDRGDALKSGDKRVCVSKSLKALDETGCEFLVVCKYAVAQGALAEDPLERPDELSGTFSTELKPYFKDVDGTDMYNSAKQPLRPLPRRFAGRFEFRVMGNRPVTTNLSAWGEFTYPYCAYNDADVTICGQAFGAKKLLLTGMTFNPQREENYVFYRFEWSLSINPQGWDIEKFDDRTDFAKDINGKIFIAGTSPPELAAPGYPLDGAGVRQATPTSAPAELSRKPYASKDFSTFEWTMEAPE